MQIDNQLPNIIRINKDKCVNCHRCISVCPVKYCNNASDVNNGIAINPKLCIACGRCVQVCTHEAREILDDTPKFISDLKEGIKIATLVAPAIDVNFPYELNHLLGWFKSINVQKNFDVSFGAEIATYKYVQAVSNKPTGPIIAQPCPCIVNYIEIYKPNLIKYLAPIGSPVMDLAKLVHHHYPEYKLAFISPCIAKKIEFEDPNTGKLISYNVTIHGIKKYLKENNISLKDHGFTSFDGSVEAEKGILFSQPGGLIESFKRYNVPLKSSQIRRVEGIEVYNEFFDELESELAKDNCNVALIDILNCKNGCNKGTGTDYDKLNVTKALRLQSERLEKQISTYYKQESDYTKLINTLKSMDNIDFSRNYTDKSEYFKALQDPDEDMVDVIHQQMGKETLKDIKDCGACGYNSCNSMAKAVLNNLYRPQQCHHFLESYYNKFSGEGDFKYLVLRRLTRYRYYLINNIAKEKYYYFNNLFVKFGWLYQKKGFKSDIAHVIDEVFNENLTLDDVVSNKFTTLIDFIIDCSSKYINHPHVNADILKNTIRRSYIMNSQAENTLFVAIKLCVENIAFFEKQNLYLESSIKSESEKFSTQIAKLTSLKGVDTITAAGIITEIGGIKRFEDNNSLLKEAGLCEDVNENNIEVNEHLKYYLIRMTEQLKLKNPVFSQHFNTVYKEHQTYSYRKILNILTRKTANLVFMQLNKFNT